jgi:hypothetical protein
MSLAMNESGSKSQAVFCPHCKHLMLLVRTIPVCGALPELRTFFCVKCREAETQEIPASATAVAPRPPSNWETRRAHREH